MATQDRRSYDTAASGDAQTNIQGVITQLEAVIALRDQQVRDALADFQADGVSDQYRGVEQRWNGAAEEVRSIVTLLRTTLENNDATAQNALTRARAAVDGIG